MLSSRAKRGILSALFRNRSRRSLAPLGMTACLILLAAAPRAAPRADDPKDAEAVIAKFKEKDPDLTGVFASARGYAVYPTVGKGGIGIGGAHGKGYVYEGGKLIGTSSLTQVTIGLQLGGQAYSEVVFLKDQYAMQNFKRGKLKLSAQATAVALTERAAADLSYLDGVAIVTMAKGGLMYEASVGGQKFSFKGMGQ